MSLRRPIVESADAARERPPRRPCGWFQSLGGCLALACGLAPVSAVTGHPGASVPADEVVALPQVEVEASRLEEIPLELLLWRYAKLDHLEVLSNVPDGVARLWIEEEAWMERVNRELIQPLVGQAPIGTVTLVLCHDQMTFDRFGRHDLNGSRSFSILLSEDRLIYILNVDRPMPWRQSMRRGSRRVPSPGVYSYYRANEARAHPPAPPWLAPAMWAFMDTIHLSGDRKSLLLGKSTRGLLHGEFNHQLTKIDARVGTLHDALDPQFLIKNQAKIQRQSWHAFPAPHPPDIGWLRQVFFFLHYVLMAEEGRYEPALRRYLAGLSCHLSPEQWFKECFGLSLEQMDTKLTAYRKRSLYAVRAYPNVALGA